MSITIHTGSILDSKADCIVNPANSFLRHGGGLAAIIDRAAQTYAGGDYRNTAIAAAIPNYDRNPAIEALWQYKSDHANAPLIATGNAYWTSAGMLPFKGIVHAVGPIWAGGQLHERSLLQAAYQNACAVAHENSCRSIAFPAISAGVFGYPPEKVARVAVKAVQFWSTPQPDGLGMSVEFWPFGHEAIFEDVLARWGR